MKPLKTIYICQECGKLMGEFFTRKPEVRKDLLSKVGSNGLTLLTTGNLKQLGLCGPCSGEEEME